MISNDRDRLCVVLVRTRNPLNLGAAARAMSNFGFFQLRVVQPYEPTFREARSAVGAASLLKTAQNYESLAAAVGDCSLVVGTTAIGKRKLEQPVHALEAGAKIIRRRLATGRVAILFGSEKTGLSNDELSHCHWLLHIPTRPEHLAMNLGQAVAVTLYELSRSVAGSGMKKSAELANASELERLTETLVGLATASGFFTGQTSTSGEQKLRRLIRRLRVQPADAELLLGLARQIVWKMRAPTEES